MLLHDVLAIFSMHKRDQAVFSSAIILKQCYANFCSIFHPPFGIKQKNFTTIEDYIWKLGFLLFSKLS